MKKFLIIIILLITTCTPTLHAISRKKYITVNDVKLLNLKALSSKDSISGKFYAVFLSGSSGTIQNKSYLKLFVSNDKGITRIITLPSEKIDIIETNTVKPMIVAKYVRKCIHNIGYCGQRIYIDDLFLEWYGFYGECRDYFSGLIKINQENMNDMIIVLKIFSQIGNLIIYIPEGSISYNFKLN